MAGHDWQRDILQGEGICISCNNCGQIWRPHQFKPRNPCRIAGAREAAAAALERGRAAALNRKDSKNPSTNEGTK